VGSGSETVRYLLKPWPEQRQRVACRIICFFLEVRFVRSTSGRTILSSTKWNLVSTVSVLSRDVRTTEVKLNHSDYTIS
jgi:hypothetical protein